MRLSDFKDEDGIEVVAKLLVPIGHISANPKNAEAKDKGLLDFASALLQNNRRDAMDIFAILNGVAPEDYHCNGATVLFDTMNFLSDPALLSLFGLQRKTSASSSSASTTGEAAEAFGDSSATAKRG